MHRVDRTLSSNKSALIDGLKTYDYLATDRLSRLVRRYVDLRNQTDRKESPLKIDIETLDYVIAQTRISLQRTFSSYPSKVENPSGVKMAAHFGYWMVRLRPISFSSTYGVDYKEEENVKIAFDLATGLCEGYIHGVYEIPESILYDENGKKLRFIWAFMTNSFLNDLIVYTQQFVATPQHFLFMLESFLEGKLGDKKIKKPDESW